jgi:signal peptidase I
LFGLFTSQENKMRQNAANWLELAQKVWALRRDVLTTAEASSLQERREELGRLLRDRADAAKLKLAIESLEEALRRAGGAVYPKSSLTENVEFFVVAAIVILGIRTYFVQPFKIPTNSMWPTYYGMTAENLPPDRPAPSLLGEIFRFAAFGAVRHEALAPRAGAVTAAFFSREQMAYTKKSGRSWLVFPADLREYTFYVDGEPTTVDVPWDFSAGAQENAGSFEDLVIDTYFGSRAAFEAQWDRLVAAHQLVQQAVVTDLTTRPNGVSYAYLVPLGRSVAANQPVIRFDILTGDQLFVDRFSYHFMRPKVGQGFVFRTGNIYDYSYPRKPPGVGEIYQIPKDDYYIKRLVGTPGDVISVQPPTLYRNGRPITGADAFALNANVTAPYTGYTNPAQATFLPPGGAVTVPPDGFFAMGDNSSNSADGRYWGFVPAADVVGRPLFIYFPFTHRWGPAR